MRTMTPPRHAWTSPAIARLALVAGLGLAAPLGAQASPIDTTQLDGPIRTLTYSTAASFDAYGPAWRPLEGVAFEGVQGRTVQTAAPFRKDSYPDVLADDATAALPLGRLLVGAPTDGERAGGGTFGLRVTIEAVDGVRLDAPVVVDLQAIAEGTLRADGESSLTYGILGYSIHPPYTPPMSVAGSFNLDDLSHTVLIPDSAFGRATFRDEGAFALDGRLISALAYNTPEPSAFLLFAAAAVGLVLRSRRVG